MPGTSSGGLANRLGALARRLPRRLPAAVLICGVGLLAAAATTSTLGAPRVYAAAPCDSSGSPVQVHYQVTAERLQGVLDLYVSGIDLSGFPSQCDGQMVTLEAVGNEAGDPSVPASSDHLLSTADSALSPCGEQKLAQPLTIALGAISLGLCRSGGPAGYFSLHDVTGLALFLPAPDGGALGATTTGSPTAAVPVTGSSLQLPALLLVVGLALLILGLLMVALRERRPGEGG